jgi:hypothetical protein
VRVASSPLPQTARRWRISRCIVVGCPSVNELCLSRAMLRQIWL